MVTYIFIVYKNNNTTVSNNTISNQARGRPTYTYTLKGSWKNHIIDWYNSLRGKLQIVSMDWMNLPKISHLINLNKILWPGYLFIHFIISMNFWDSIIDVIYSF